MIEDDTSTSDDDPLSILEKWLLLIGGVGIPVFTHLILVQNFGGNSWIGSPRYQTGLLKDKLAFLLTFDALAWMYPLIGFSMVAYATLVIEIRLTGDAFWARFGLITGIPLGLGFHFIFLCQTGFGLSELFIFHLVPVVSVALIWGFSKLLIAWTRDRRAAFVAGVTILFALLTFISAIRVIMTGDHSNWALIAFPIFALLYGAILYGPLIWLGCYGWMIGRVLSLHPSASQFSIAGMMGWVSWLGGYFAAWRHAVLQSLESYSRLPTTDPGGCYVATAACHGHEWLVRSMKTDGGYVFNEQLQTLKAFELAFQVLAPRLHRMLRRTYDLIGPPIARRLQSPWMADLAYVSLKPMEWIAIVALRVGLAERYPTASMLYRNRRSPTDAEPVKKTADAVISNVPSR